MSNLQYFLIIMINSYLGLLNGYVQSSLGSIYYFSDKLWGNNSPKKEDVDWDAMISEIEDLGELKVIEVIDVDSCRISSTPGPDEFEMIDKIDVDAGEHELLKLAEKLMGKEDGVRGEKNYEMISVNFMPMLSEEVENGPLQSVLGGLEDFELIGSIFDLMYMRRAMLKEVSDENVLKFDEAFNNAASKAFQMAADKVRLDKAM